MIEIIYEYVIIAMFISFMILYIFAPATQVIYKEPSVNDVESNMYKDDKGVCYKYKRTKVTCTKI